MYNLLVLDNREGVERSSAASITSKGGSSQQKNSNSVKANEWESEQNQWQNRVVVSVKTNSYQGSMNNS